jgi:hypothetical protein
VLRNPENLPFILPYQLLERRRVPQLRARYQRNIGVDLFGDLGLDGWHR